MEIVVACGPSGVVIHPGGYSLSRKSLKGKDSVFTTSLKTIVRLRQQVDPMIRQLTLYRDFINDKTQEI